MVNSVATGTATNKSDIDLLVVTEYRKVMQARFFLVLVAQLFGIRVHGNKVAGRFCLSFIVDSEHAELQQIMFSHDPLLTELLSTKKLVFTDHKLGIVSRIIRRLFILVSPQWLIEKHTRRSIMRAQKNSFPSASVIIAPSIFKFHENDQRRV